MIAILYSPAILIAGFNNAVDTKQQTHEYSEFQKLR